MRGRQGVLLLMAFSAGCGGGKDAGLITVRANPALEIRHLDVSVGINFIQVPPVEGEALTFPKTISVSFPSEAAGTLRVTVRGFNGAIQVAEESAERPTVRGGVTRIDIELGFPGVDAGDPDGAGGG